MPLPHIVRYDALFPGLAPNLLALGVDRRMAEGGRAGLNFQARRLRR